MQPTFLGEFADQIFNGLEDGLLVVDENGVILDANEAMERISGYSKNELVGSPCSLIDCDACERIMEEDKKSWCRLFETGAFRRKRCTMIRKDGSFVPVLEDATLIKDSRGLVVAALEKFTDISDEAGKVFRIREQSLLGGGEAGWCGMVGESAPMQRVFTQLDKAARSDAPVIIYGETGTGKELAAEAIHQMGRRKDGPFVRFNCAALNEALLESELFGHVKGAFTGAHRHHKGRFEAAHGGDLFLDEVGDIPQPSQAKLLRVLETKQFERVGDYRPVSVDVRIITATNRNLEELIARGLFREDLFFRINVLPIHLPPLRERKDDIGPLIETFLGRMRRKAGKQITSVSEEIMALFMEYPWPGNVRELKSVLEYSFAFAESEQIGRRHLPPYFTATEKAPEANPQIEISSTGGVDSEEKTALMEALRQAGGVKTLASRILGINRMTVYNRMKKYGIRIKR